MNKNRIAALATSALVVGCSGGVIQPGQDLVTGDGNDVVIHSVHHAGSLSDGERGMLSLRGAPDAIYLNRNGRTYTAGDDDSAAGVSSVVLDQRLSSATIPPLNWTDAKWQQFLSCIQDEYARFNVLVTDKRPTSGSYIEAAVGGTGAALGYGSNVGGVAPVDTYLCQPIPKAVVFIFGGNGYSAQATCEIAAQEIGHAIVPLDHEYLASDPMTYLSYNGHKTFQNVDAQCGEYAPRACFCRRASQNSVKLLTSTLGRAGSGGGGGTGGGGGGGGGGGDMTPPRVAVSAPADNATLPANSAIQVSVTASDPDDAVSSVSLYWDYTSRALPCDSSISGVTCTHSGNTWTWSINVGTGARTFHAVATDSHNNTAQSPTMHLTLSDGQTPPMQNPPTVTVTGPANGTTFGTGDPLNITADVADGGTVTQVIVKWTNAAGTTTFAMSDQGNGHYALNTSISSTATAGPRSFTVTATDDAGLSTTSPAITLDVQ